MLLYYTCSFNDALAQLSSGLVLLINNCCFLVNCEQSTVS